MSDLLFPRGFEQSDQPISDDTTTTKKHDDTLDDLKEVSLLSRLVKELKGLKPNDYSTALVHLYRGELARQTTYRQRLDQTTNWAITISATMTGFSLSNVQIEHYVHFLILFFIFVFLIIEARRYRYYITSQSRVRLLETGFYSGIILAGCAPSTAIVNRYENWEKKLMITYDHAHSPISLLHAIVIRFRRLYAWLTLAVLIGWVLKLRVSDDVHPAIVAPVFILFFIMVVPLPFVYQNKEDDV